MSKSSVLQFKIFSVNGSARLLKNWPRLGSYPGWTGRRGREARDRRATHCCRPSAAVSEQRESQQQSPRVRASPRSLLRHAPLAATARDGAARLNSAPRPQKGPVVPHAGRHAWADAVPPRRCVTCARWPQCAELRRLATGAELSLYVNSRFIEKFRVSPLFIWEFFVSMNRDHRFCLDG